MEPLLQHRPETDDEKHGHADVEPFEPDRNGEPVAKRRAETGPSGNTGKIDGSEGHPTSITVRKYCVSSVYVAIAVTAITHALGLTHWNAAAARKLIGCEAAVPSWRLRDVPIFHAIQTR